MRRVLVLAAVTALAVARPETYREKEDFQYSRSSSDDGTKSGFYGAQRGNMGGNYERAHNMDSLAQHQMGSLVKNVEGELGDGAKEKSGSVFTAANSRGIYGSGRYDLSNLAGRNFQEGTSYGDSESHSSLSSHQAGYGSNSRTYSSSSNSAYGSQSQDSRYQTYNSAANSDRALYDSSIQSADNLQASEYDNTRATHGSGHYSQSGYQGQNSYDQAAASQHLSNAYGTYNTRGSQYRLVGSSPVKVIIRPGSTVTVPVAAQSFDASHGSSATFDQNSINTDAQILNSQNQLEFRPSGADKHYESSYSYRKEWEKHDTVTAVPLAIPTTYRPYPSNSELYEDSEAHGSVRQHESRSQESRNNYSNSQFRGYSGTKTGSSSHQAAYSAQQQGASDTSALSSGSLGTNTQRTYNYANNLNSGNLNSQVEDFRPAPKSYQSSYSYHKSWERQGDPYVIQPSTNGEYTSANSQAAQRLTSSSLNRGSSYGSHQYGSRYQQGHGYSDDCDENSHIRVARSYNSYQQNHNINAGQEQLRQQAQNLEDFGQQSQKLEDFGQQSQNLEDFGQQSQNLQEFGQQSQKLEDFGQQSQNLEDFGQQSQNLEDFGQQSQNLQEFGQQSQKLEDFGQQSQNLQDFDQESQNLQDFGQQSQNLQDIGQQPQNLENLGQQPQKLEDFGQESQNLENFGQETQILESFGQTSQNLQDVGQETQNLDNFGQQSQNLHDFGQETQNLQNFGQETQQNFGQESQNLDDFGQLSQNVQNLGQQTQNLADFGQATQNSFDKIEDLSQHTQNQQTGAGQETQNTWDLLETQHSTNHHYDQQSQDGAFVISHSSVNQPESHIVDDKSNPFSVFGIDHPSENTMVDDTNKLPGQQTHSFNSYVDQNNYNSYFPVPLSNSDRVSQLHNHMNWQSHLNNHHINTGDGRPQHESVGTWIFNPPYDASINTRYPGNLNANYNPNPWSFNPSYTQPSQNIPLPHDGHTYTNTQTYHRPDFSNTYTQTCVNRYNHSTFSTSNVHIENTTALTDLWDFIDGIEKDTIPEHHVSTNCTEQEKDQINSNTDYTQQNNENSFNSTNKVDVTQNFHDVLFNNNGKVDSIELSTVASSTIKNDNLHPHHERGDIGTEKPKPNTDLGRGDIEPEYSSDEELNPPNRPLEILGAHHALHKTPEEIEILSLAKESNKTSALPNNKTLINESSAVSLNENRTHYSEQENWKLQLDTQKTTTTPKAIYGYEDPQFNEGQEVEHNTAQQFEFGQIEQHTNHHLENVNHKEAINKYQQNIHHHIVDFGQQSEQNFQNVYQQSVNLGQHVAGHSVSSLEVTNDDIQQQNVGQQIEGNIDQQNYNQFDLGQQTQEFEQDLQSYGQQNNHFHQETLDNFAKDEQFQQESLSNFDQDTGDIGQENVDLAQQRQTGNLWNTEEEQKKKLQVELFQAQTENKEGKTLQSEPVKELEDIAKQPSNVETPPEPVTEKVGFWNKFGSKLSSAKNKVKSWFSSS